MAQLQRKQQLEGVIGPFYIRELNGKTIMQSRTINPRQSKGTRASGLSFSYAVKQSKAVRQVLRPLLEAGTDPYASQRLTGALHQAFHFPQGYEEPYTLFTADLSALVGFEFHQRSPLRPLLPFTFPFEVTDDGCLCLPAVEVAAVPTKLLPDTRSSCALVFMVASWAPNVGDKAATAVFSFEMHRHIPTAMALQTDAYPEGTRLIVAAQLLVWNGCTVLGDKNYCNSKSFNPVQVVFTGVV
ncbi:hypothetical protein [Flavobacterium phycosphaerae]|uniref:hypothetical protein n=1 Tax=Flavobacterium phycosphaerae TaxID=2697515 RepID=UPI00138A5754|nr:hypothetical protein [Flavobacterium phycosphaerae]